MYKTKIKKPFRNPLWFSDRGYSILGQMGEEHRPKALLYNEDKGILYDIYMSKLEEPQYDHLFSGSLIRTGR